MRVINTTNRNTRKVYAEKVLVAPDVYEYFLSPFDKTDAVNRRPIDRFDTAQELELFAMNRGCQVVWLT